MPYRRDIAAQTLINVAAALRNSWTSLSPGLRQALAKLIDEGGHDLYRQKPGNRASACVRMLDQVAALPDLPPAVISVLAAGAGITATISVQVTEQQRDQVLRALSQVYDARQYRDPFALAEELHQRVNQVKGRFDAETRLRWDQLDATFGSGNPSKYLDELDRLLADKLPFVREALDAGKTWEPVHRTAARPPRAIPDSSSPPEDAGSPLEAVGAGVDQEPALPSAPALDVPAAPVRVQRTANVYFPDALQLTQKMTPLIVHIAREAAAGTVAVTQGKSSVSLTVGDLIISVLAPDFDVDFAIGGAEVPGVPSLRRVRVDPDADSEPVIFFLSPVAGCDLGTKRISIEFLQHNKRQGSLGFEVVIVDRPLSAAEVRNVVDPGFPLAPRATTSSQADDVPELSLRVSLQGSLLSYWLVSADGRHLDRPLGQKSLVQADPRTYFTFITDRLSQLAAQPVGEEDERDEAQRRKDEDQLRALGVRLWEELIPDTFAQVYDEDLRLNDVGKSLVITSDEPWIPWEMVRPFKRQGGQMLYIDPPLCEQFKLTRWLDGQAPPDRLQVRRGVIVAPEDNLQFVKEELAYFSSLDWTVSIHTLDQVHQEFGQGLAQLFHFSCHGRAGAGGAEEASLKIGQDFLTPSDVLGRPVKLYECKPLIFLNACEAGQPGFNLTGLGGWARAFIKLEASIFIGSLWAINDKLAAEFAESFYNRLWGLNGQVQHSVGEAFHAARQDIKRMAPGNPTWLAYVLYGDPNGRVFISP